MRWFKAIVAFLGTMFLGMFGGQKEKGARRFGISGLAIGLNWKKGWPLVFLIPVLVMGYGDNSWLMDKIGIEFLVRFAYSFLLALPFAFYGIKRGLFAFVSLAIAFQIHGGSLGHIGWFGDILLEDMIRYGTLGVNIAFNLFF